ncbi:MAG: DUF134 domain-containing protein [Candidatus Peribacteraceae bacterium]|nr:DUF134 domain-containing protein [Candidatus Peribacteraceae bacterium]
MPRPQIRRRIRGRFRADYFKPAGVPLRKLTEVVLRSDEVEALRLKNVQKLDQNSAAAEMKISQSTFQRILARAQQKIAIAICTGKAIRIEK